MVRGKKFPSPFEVETIPGTEGWQRMYPYHIVFSEERKELEEKKFWYWDSMHWPGPKYPFEQIVGDALMIGLKMYLTRVFCVPVSNGSEVRLLNGYSYMAPQFTDPDEVTERIPIFMKRSGFYYEHWDDLYQNRWVPKMEALIEELKQIEFNILPKYEPDSMALEGKNYSSGHTLLQNFNKLIFSLQKAWQYHWEFNILVYPAYLTFYDFCMKAFPGIMPGTIAKMVSGTPNLLMYRPDEELCKLAKLAVNLHLNEVFKRELPPDEIISKLKCTDGGKKWLLAMDEVKDPWFYVSSGSGFHHYDRSWIDDLSIPFGYIRSYIEKLERGEKIERPVEKISRERDRLQREYCNLLPTEEDKNTFNQCYQTLIKVFPYAENHIFYVEHWYHTIFWQKARELGSILVSAGFLNEPNDIFYFYSTDILSMLTDIVLSWSGGSGPTFPPRGLYYWPKELKWRKEVMQKFHEWTPPPALGPVPEKITDPMTIQLWGITRDSLDKWLGVKEFKPEEVTELKGFPASAGTVEGRARVILTPEELSNVKSGEILVCTLISPSWAPIFSKIQAVVTNIGGMSSHAAIVAREYGLPAVVGTGVGTKVIMTGNKLKVDGTTGIITIIR